ncbi:MFS transporter [Pseudonocardia sp. CA-107938]|uniref:MFS transporter n=1 Tax=Pseudonocardia sp. CA-107938 TaxID=3240021 RepID=UPI003D8D9463
MSTTACTRPGVDRRTTLTLAVIAALAAGSIYYVQPLLDTIAREFGVGPAAAGLLVTATQLGFVAGLAVGGPLGDRTSRRTLVTALLATSAATLALAAVTPAFWLLVVAMTAIGIAAAAAQVAVPFAAQLADPAHRGRVTGTVMGGLLLGILLARTVSGAVAGAAGWRSVFVAAAVVMAVLTVVAWRLLPADRDGKDPRGLGALIGSIAGLVRAEPVLRNRMLLGALGMFGFSATWTASAFLLAGHYGLPDPVIGLFGLAGAAGALAAPLVGRFADRGHGARATTAGWILVAAGWGLLWLGGSSLVAFVAGLLVLDMAVQALQISNQNRIYQLDPAARGRITTAYMVSMFSGGMVGSVVGASAFAQGGWTAVCVAGLVVAGLGGARWCATRDR